MSHQPYHKVDFTLTPAPMEEPFFIVQQDDERDAVEVFAEFADKFKLTAHDLLGYVGAELIRVEADRANFKRLTEQLSDEANKAITEARTAERRESMERSRNEGLMKEIGALRDQQKIDGTIIGDLIGAERSWRERALEYKASRFRCTLAAIIFGMALGGALIGWAL